MRVGIILTGDYSWAGGVYYSLNIIRLLQKLSKTRPLTVVVIANAQTPPELIADLPKAGIEIVYLDRKPLLYRLWHRLRNDRFVADINALRLNVVYPLTTWDSSHRGFNCRAVYWIYDLQHKFLPELFTEAERNKRDAVFGDLARHAPELVFSSYDSKQHFEQFYAFSPAKRHVYHFVSPRPSLIETHTQPDLPANYLIVCNQFWPHKNHLVVLKAIQQLVATGSEPFVVFTGRYTDPQNAAYVKELQDFISGHGLDRYLRFTGFLPRAEQSALMAGSLAVIQPSFFEGWSTVIEDAKALNKFVIASTIAVNREQIAENVLFFEPDNAALLAQLIRRVMEHGIELKPLNYDANIEVSTAELVNLLLA